jgi:hypothetical protein
LLNVPQRTVAECFAERKNPAARCSALVAVAQRGAYAGEMPDDEQRLTERLMVQLSASDLRALSAISDEMERSRSWVARRAIRLYIAQVLSAEETLLRSDEVIARVREAHQRGEET